jgi:mRNA-degrading endonuclease toxin of MazEF toxin-antitoxin module
MNSPEGQSGGLRLDSVIDCTVIATIPKTLLVSKIGAFPQDVMEKVDQCLMIAMSIGRPVGGPLPEPTP